ncbi:hypothetical protein [uncultured Deefgea sp.]|uniref:hypothetical protein n=1 Tax=uncultured Deefgea sp. TaxID=1304914 RepID=UPI0026140A7B|nr:hypothetical protein [uncultured Deefgea sp.]
MSDGKIENVQFEKYEKFLKENSRPPSRGGNTKALHSHVLTIGGEKYSFLSLGSQQWAHKSDSLSFDYEVNDGYKNIIKETFIVKSKAGEPIVRGNHGFKPTLRTAVSRMPASKREQRS